MVNMSKAQPRVLLIEDRLSLARCYTEFLAAEDCEIIHASTGAEGLAVISADCPDVVLLDLQLPDMDGLRVLQQINQQKLSVTVVVITAYSTHDTSRKVLEQGAADFLEKPFTKDRLCFTLRKALKRQELVGSVSETRNGYCGFMGSSLVMQAVYNTIESAAASKASVFITGESGTGKEVCAQAIHQMSQRYDHDFVTINCAAIPHNLMESEIFGHVKGAFTGAVGNREGAAAIADGGTLFLDEIGEMDLELQSKLLRFIQTGQFQPVGSNELKTVDVRFVCATNRNPLDQVKDGSFREDLYYRLHVVPIQLPALRERGSDILELAEKYLKEYAFEENKAFRRLAEETKQHFMSYYWPGNVRQMLNVLRNIVVLHDGEEVHLEMLPAPLNDKQQYTRLPTGDDKNKTKGGLLGPDGKPKTTDDIKPLWRVEMEAIEEAIEICGGSVAKAAECLGVSPSTLYRKKPHWKRGDSEQQQTA